MEWLESFSGRAELRAKQPYTRVQQPVVCGTPGSSAGLAVNMYVSVGGRQDSSIVETIAFMKKRTDGPCSVRF